MGMDFRSLGVGCESLKSHPISSLFSRLVLGLKMGALGFLLLLP